MATQAQPLPNLRGIHLVIIFDDIVTKFDDTVIRNDDKEYVCQILPHARCSVDMAPYCSQVKIRGK